ncbi:hypothetical protein DERP_010620 [Dermatophagoides pteronyssinus]|uniref:Uncharacterized protein n=1 Tax=Dermatophagoides pteronyssinus TaxID=6956 RepID=A0ABQ8J9X2_DERPT|nr:hypothetical protein DERP_010620 [Dermatophagoides pteronyssinus]
MVIPLQKPDAMKIIPAPKLDKPGEERWPDNNNLLLENDFNNNQQKQQQQQPRQQQQRSPPYSEHHHHQIYNNGETSPNDPNSNIMQQQQQQQGTPKKRTRPVIRIKADRPPIRINSVGQIKLKAERQMRLKPKIPHSPGPTRSKIIPEKYLQNMPPLRNLDDNINTQSSPPQRTTSSSSSYGSGGNGGKKYTPSSSMNYDQQQITRYNNYKNKPTTTTMKTLKLSSPSSGHHQHQHHQHNIRSKLNDDNDNNGKFEPIYRPSSSSSSKPSSSSSYSDSDSSGEESGSGSKSAAGHRPMTIRTSEGLEQLEKNNYDKQLLKTLKNLMVTGGKRHKLDFEDKEEGEIHRIQSKGKIPEKYLKQFPSEDSRYHQQHSHSSNSDQDPDLNNNNNNDNSDLDDNQSLGSTYQDYDTRNNGKLSNEPSYEDMGDDLNDDTSDSSDEHYESIRPSSPLPTPQSQSSIRSSMIRRYRVKGYDPNYEYIGPEPNSAESEQINHIIHHHLLDLNDMEQPTAAITEQIGHDGRKVKTYVLSGVYRKKVDEILRNDHTDGNDDDDDGGGSSYSSDHADESRQIVHFFKPNDNVVGDEQKLHDLLEKCDDDPNVDSNSSVDNNNNKQHYYHHHQQWLFRIQQ